MNARATDIADVYFVGALTDPAKTDLIFEYRAVDGKVRLYTPDFLLRRLDGRWLLVEIKRASARLGLIEGEQGLKAQAMRALVDRNPGRLQYEMVFATGNSVLTSDLKAAHAFAESCGPVASA